jgi:hypothetical protein
MKAGMRFLLTDDRIDRQPLPPAREGIGSATDSGQLARVVNL